MSAKETADTPGVVLKEAYLPRCDKNMSKVDKYLRTDLKPSPCIKYTATQWRALGGSSGPAEPPNLGWVGGSDARGGELETKRGRG